MMGHKNQLRCAKLAAMLSLFVYASASIAATGEFETSVAADSSAIVEISNQKGEVVVRGADVDKVTVYALIKVDKRYARTDPQKAAKLIGAIRRSPPVETDGNRVIIGKLKKHTQKRYASISYEILVPSEATVKVRSISGDVRVSGVSGEVNATSEKGEVTVAEANDTRTAKSSS